jgi:hypothetical protein
MPLLQLSFLLGLVLLHCGYGALTLLYVLLGALDMPRCPVYIAAWERTKQASHFYWEHGTQERQAEGRDLVAPSWEHRLSEHSLQGGNGIPVVRVIFFVEFVMGSGQLGLGESISDLLLICTVHGTKLERRHV